jgi:excisionase family DNA binding protein
MKSRGEAIYSRLRSGYIWIRLAVVPSSHPAPIAISADAVGERTGYSISQTAALLGVSRVTVSRWIRAGRLPASRLGHRTVRIRYEDLERLLLETRSDGPGPWVGRHPVEETAAGGEESGRDPRPGWWDNDSLEHVV